jgi:DNA-binding CsgD family transcriptional regulator
VATVSFATLPPLVAAGLRVSVLGDGVVEAVDHADIEVVMLAEPAAASAGACLAIWTGRGGPPEPGVIGVSAVVDIHAPLADVRRALEQLAPEGSVSPGASPVRLTRREQAIFSWVATGATSREIARRLEISERTVEVHRRNLLRKLGVRRSAGLVGLAMRGEVTAG